MIILPFKYHLIAYNTYYMRLVIIKEKIELIGKMSLVKWDIEHSS